MMKVSYKKLWILLIEWDISPATLRKDLSIATGTMNGMMGGMNQTVQAPPPVPSVMYYVAVNGQATGPYDMTALGQMAAAGTFTKTSLVWKQGMAQWTSSETIPELGGLFASSTMPPVPPNGE